MTTELENLLAVFHEVDRGLADDPRNVEAVAELLPPYAGGAATGWVDTLERWAAARAMATTTAAPVTLPDVDTALDALASTPPPVGLEPRRALTLDALARAYPERYGPHGTDRHRVSAGRPPSGRGPQLASNVLFVDTEDGQVGRVTFGVVVPVVDLDQAHAVAAMNLILDPGTWPELLPDCWDEMTPLDHALVDEPLAVDELRSYQEKFHVTDWLQLTPVLEFRRTRLVPAADGCAQCLEYDLVAGEANENDLVQRDAGAIVAQFADETLRVRTTKRVRFRPPFDGPGLAMFASALGYLDASVQMVLKAIDDTSAQGPSGATHGDTER